MHAMLLPTVVLKGNQTGRKPCQRINNANNRNRNAGRSKPSYAPYLVGTPRRMRSGGDLGSGAASAPVPALGRGSAIIVWKQM